MNPHFVDFMTLSRPVLVGFLVITFLLDPATEQHIHPLITVYKLEFNKVIAIEKKFLILYNCHLI